MSLVLRVDIRIKQIATNPDAARSTLRLIDFFTIPKHNGNSTVLMLSHPGVNTLARYFAPSQVNDLLLAKQKPSPQSDVYKMVMEPDKSSQSPLQGDSRVMDLTTFLESVYIAALATILLLKPHQICHTSNTLLGHDT